MKKSKSEKVGIKYDQDNTYPNRYLSANKDNLKFTKT